MKTAADLIAYFAIPHSNYERIFTTTKVRKDIFLQYDNAVVRGGFVYQFIWHNMKGGIWQVSINEIEGRKL